LLAEIATTPTQSLPGVVAKIAVILREATDNTDLCEFPLPHIRSALADLRRLTHEATNDQTAGWPAGDQSIGALFEQSHRPSPPGAPLAPGARAMMRPVAAGRTYSRRCGAQASRHGKSLHLIAQRSLLVHSSMTESKDFAQRRIPLSNH
jgi:hypothetical protein